MNKGKNHNKWFIKLKLLKKMYIKAVHGLFIYQPEISIDDQKGLQNSYAYIRIAANEMGLLDSEIGYRRKDY